MTTVIRGQHTAHLSRESVTSTVATIALDKSIVEVVRDNDGLIEPTRLQELGTKTKGLATTIYNALYQVQIYNEDLYKVIQKTYNKNLSFKPLQTTTTAYQPIFMTKELSIPKETPVAPTPSTSAIDNNEFDLVRNTNVLKESSPTVLLSSPLFNVDNQNVHSPMIITSSIVEPSHQSVSDTVQATPNIKSSLHSLPQFTTDSSSTSRSGPIRISSSVVRKPYNPRYTYPISRSKLRMRVSSRTSLLHPEISSSISDPELFSPTAVVSTLTSSVFESPIISQEQQVTTQQETNIQMTSSTTTEPLPSTSISTDSSTTAVDHTELPVRPNLFRSKVIYRPRPKQTLSNGQVPNSKMIRISSRLIRPGASNLVEPGPELSPTPVFSSPVVTSTSMNPESTVTTKVIYLNLK